MTNEKQHTEIDAPIDEGDYVLLSAKVYRANSEQALIEFRSMEGPFSVRVPLSELTRITAVAEALQGDVVRVLVTLDTLDQWTEDALTQGISPATYVYSTLSAELGT